MGLSRRGFIGILGGLPLLLQRGGRQDKRPEPVMINRFSIAGFQYYAGPAHVHRLRVGEQLKLKAAPHNPYDSFAVEIHHGLGMLGHVPRSDNRHLSRLLQSGAILHCTVTRVAPEAPTWKMVQVEVSV